MNSVYVGNRFARHPNKTAVQQWLDPSFDRGWRTSLLTRRIRILANRRPHLNASVHRLAYPTY